MQNGANFKESEKNNFRVRWLIGDDFNFLSEDFKVKLNKFSQKIYDGNGNNFGYNMNNMNMMSSGMNPNMNPNLNPMMPNMMQMNNLNSNGLNFQNSNNYYMMMNHQNDNKNRQTPSNSMTPVSNSQNSNQNTKKHTQNNSAKYEENEDKKQVSLATQNGKYTCRFEIQIENDKEFQVARRLIGAKVNLFF